MNHLKWQLLNGNCIDVMKTIPDNSIDLIFTSPPYEDLRDYHGSTSLVGDKYVQFLKEVGIEVLRILRPGGSFILNIQSKIDKKTKQRTLTVHKTVIELVENVGFSYIEPYIWSKTSSTPYKSNLRCYNAFEYCFWFSKGIKDVTFNMDNIRRPYAESTIKRYQYKTHKNFGNITPDGKRIYSGGENTHKKIEVNPKGSLHPNVISLPQCTGLNKNHPAQMQPKLAEFFIKAGSNPGDIVLDPFIGSGTTIIEALKYGCNGIGIDIAVDYLSETYKSINIINPNNKYEEIIKSPYTYKY